MSAARIAWWGRACCSLLPLFSKGGWSFATLTARSCSPGEAMSLFEALYIVHMQIMLVIAYLQYVEIKNDRNNKK